MAKTFYPTFRRLLHRIAVYTAKHNATLTNIMTSNGYGPQWTAFYNALQAFESALALYSETP